MNVYDFEATRIDGSIQPLSDYRGQVLLIVNTATRCGLTPQLDGLEKLHENYRDRGFAVLVRSMGFTLIEAAHMCSTTPARELGLHGLGAIARDAFADLVVLDRDLRVVETYVSGVRVLPEQSGR